MQVDTIPSRYVVYAHDESLIHEAYQAAVDYGMQPEGAPAFLDVLRLPSVLHPEMANVYAFFVQCGSTEAWQKLVAWQWDRPLSLFEL